MKDTYFVRKKTNVMMKNIIFVVVTMLFILISAFFVAGTVQSQSAGQLCVDETYYRELEKEYVQDIREYLNAQGFENSGVTLTRVTEEDGSREYEILLHHKYLNKLSEEKREVLFEGIKAMAFGAEGCSFRVDLLAS